MTFLLMPNENIHDSWSPDNEKWYKEYHDLSWVKRFVLECVEKNPLSPETEEKLRNIEGVKSAKIELTFEPPWEKDMMSEVAQLELGFM